MRARIDLAQHYGMWLLAMISPLPGMLLPVLFVIFWVSRNVGAEREIAQYRPAKAGGGRMERTQLGKKWGTSKVAHARGSTGAANLDGLAMTQPWLWNRFEGGAVSGCPGILAASNRVWVLARAFFRVTLAIPAHCSQPLEEQDE
jgi:hypothetical protein